MVSRLSYSEMANITYYVFLVKIPLNLLDEFNNPSKLSEEKAPVLSAR